LLPSPALLLADEPTGNLDAESAEIVLKAMRSFAGQGGAVLLVTHDEDAAARADAVYSMEAGRLQSP
jgi:putative ABC transport system ATP-binding protein